MDVPIANAIAASIELTGRSGKQEVTRAMILMARSARAATKQSAKKRKVKKDQYGEYIEPLGEYSQKKIYKWQVGPNRRQSESETRPNVLQFKTWEDVQTIRNRGLAKRSWFWGLEGLNKAPAAERKPIPGTVELQEFLSSSGCGLVLTNRLGYIFEAAPRNVAEIAAQKASTQIMRSAAKTLERKFGVTVPRLAASKTKARQKTLPEVWQQGGLAL
jgi:hypothetical protein